MCKTVIKKSKLPYGWKSNTAGGSDSLLRLACAAGNDVFIGSQDKRTNFNSIQVAFDLDDAELRLELDLVDVESPN